MKNITLEKAKEKQKEFKSGINEIEKRGKFRSAKMCNKKN